MRKLRGMAIGPVIVAIAALAVGAVAGGAVVYWYMSSHQGGHGEDAPSESVEEIIEETVPEETQPETLPPPVLEDISSVEIVVSGNGYLYQGAPLTLEQLTGVFQVLEDDTPIKVTDDRASMHAYGALLDALEEQGIAYIEVTE